MVLFKIQDHLLYLHWFIIVANTCCTWQGPKLSYLMLARLVGNVNILSAFSSLVLIDVVRLLVETLIKATAR